MLLKVQWSDEVPKSGRMRKFQGLIEYLPGSLSSKHRDERNSTASDFDVGFPRLGLRELVGSRIGRRKLGGYTLQGLG